MTKIKFKIIITFLILFNLAASASAEVTITKAEVIDSAGSPRTRFSSKERMGLKIETNNTSEVSRIDYKFEIYGPSGNSVFTHTGNSSPGNIGRGGTSLSNIPLTFYSGTGDYTFKSYVIVNGTVKDTERTYFKIYSPTINLMYPADGTTDLIDKPINFRWVSSGASRYAIQVSETQGFYRPIWSQQTTATSASYPVNPVDVNQKLKGGESYFWKVTGYDNTGKVIAKSPVFEFSPKAESETDYTRELGIRDIICSPDSIFPDDVKIDVEIANSGTQSENSIDVELFVSGRTAGTEKLNIISAGGVETVTFDIGTFLDESAIMSAALDISDSDIKNNIMSKNVVITLPEKYRNVPKIIGRVVDSLTLDNLNNIKVKYSGPMSGEVTTSSNGQFKIVNLIKGTYKLTVEEDGYNTPEPVTVNIDQKKSYPISNIELRKETVEEAPKIKEYSTTEIWDIIKNRVPEEYIKEFEQYRLVGVSIEPEANTNVMIDRIKKGKTKIKDIKVEIK